MNQVHQKSLRLLHLPNEREPGQLFDIRRAFETMLDAGILSAYEAFPFLWENKQRGTSATLEKLMQIAQAFQPDVIFWQHISEFDANKTFLQQLKAIPSSPKLIYHEGDAYSRTIKRMNRQLRTILSESDLVFLVGLGDLAAMVRECGAKKVFYAPHAFDNIRFGKPWTPTLERSYDVVMVGNCGIGKILGVPGGRMRRKTALAMWKQFGERFALFGKGWEGLPCAKGLLPFKEQETVIRSSWVSVNWSHFDRIPFYFSDRLPISLAAGVPHITNYQPGYEHLFKHCEGLYMVRSVEEAVETVNYLLSLPRERLNQLGKGAQQFAFEQLETNKIYGQIVKTIIEHCFQLASA